MAEALVAARTDFPTDPLTGSLWRWAIGHVVAVKPDDFAWGALEDPRNFATRAERRFALFRFPGASIARIEKYLAAETAVDSFTGQPTTVRGRLWQIQWNSLPLAARNILTATGVLTIGPTGDFSWAQVQAFVLRLDTMQQDTEALS